MRIRSSPKIPAVKRLDLSKFADKPDLAPKSERLSIMIRTEVRRRTCVFTLFRVLVGTRCFEFGCELVV